MCVLDLWWSPFQVQGRWHWLANESLVHFLCVLWKQPQHLFSCFVIVPFGFVLHSRHLCGHGSNATAPSFLQHLRLPSKVSWHRFVSFRLIPTSVGSNPSVRRTNERTCRRHRRTRIHPCERRREACVSFRLESVRLAALHSKRVGSFVRVRFVVDVDGR